MSLGRLAVNNIRNIKGANLDLGPSVNLVIGPNGSGKTSLLESIYFLGSGRTFRSNSVDPLISRGEERCTVFGTVTTDGRQHRLGVERGRDGSRDIRMDGESVSRASELAKALPTLVLGPNTVELLTGPPGNRRRFLNWGVFHVEQSFAGLWEQANRALRQRNELLRSPGVGASDLAVWDARLADLSEQIHGYREPWFGAFQAAFEEVCRDLVGVPGVTCTYRKGWDGQEGLAAELKRQVDSDIQRGHTQSGYHRAELRIRQRGESVAAVCSRGELKVLAWAMVLSQGKVFQNQTGSDLLYLVDDLGSELDESHRDQVGALLAKTGCQVLATGIQRTQLVGGWGGIEPRVFHVEHGRFSVEETVDERR